MFDESGRGNSRGASVGLGWGLTSLSLVLAVGCGDRFAADCHETHTCMVSGGVDGLGGTSGADSGGAGGTAGESSDAGEGGGPPETCESAADCSNGDEDDGEEVCVRGTCTPGNPPPSVRFVTPKDGADDVEPDGSIVLEFSEALDAASVTPENVRILQGDVAVAGKLSHADDRVTFVPAAPLTLSGNYQVSVAAGVKDADGAGLKAPFLSAFTVRDGRWQTIDVVTKNAGSLSQQVPITAGGDVLVAWTQGAPGNCPLSAGWFARGVATKPTATLSNATGSCAEITSAANADGVASVAWWAQNPTPGVYSWQFRGAPQGSSQMVAAAPTSPWVRTAVSPDGRAVVLYNHEGDSPYVRSTDAAGAWSTPALTLKVGASRYHVTVGFDAAGNSVAVWPSLLGVETVQAATTSGETGALSMPVTVGTASYEGGDVSLAVAPSGEAVAVWYVETSVQASYFSGKSWSPPETISGDLAGFYYYTSRGLVYDGSRFIAAWDVAEGDSVFHTFTAALDPKSGWSAPERHQKNTGEGATSAMSTRIASDGHGTTFLVWAAASAGTEHELLYRRFREGRWGAVTALPGAVITGSSTGDIRLSMNASGLAALAWLNHDAKGTGTSIRLASFF
jgi:hypothetical protein